MTDPLRADALAISDQWRLDLDLGELVAAHVDDLARGPGDVDVVAIGKAASAMVEAAGAALGAALGRGLVVDQVVTVGSDASRVARCIVGDHPVPGARSLAAGAALREFLAAPSAARATLFLVSGGASSLCVAPAPPVTLDDLARVWDAALAAGLDITTLNRVRAATSLIAGGGVLREVRTAASRALIMVDNVVSGAPWVASGLTYEVATSAREAAALFDALGPLEPELRGRLESAHRRREVSMRRRVTTRHENRVIAEPGLLVEAAVGEARRRGYLVSETGRAQSGDVADVAAAWADAIVAAAREPRATCLVGAGEATVRVDGPGRGGRCQELAWRLAPVLETLGRDAVVVARSSDGRDFLDGVAGAWVDRRTMSRARDAGLDWSGVLDAHDTFTAHAALGQVIEGRPTGWNLCDVYVALLAAR